MNTLFTEAIKLKDGILYNLAYHQRRVDRTLQYFYGTAIDLSVLQHRIPADKQTGLYKCRVVYGDRLLVVECIPYSFRKISNVCIVRDNEIEYGYKFADRSRLNALLERSGCDEMILVKNNRVADSSAANLVFMSDAGLFTPEHCLLPGTKRQYLLDKGIIRTKDIRLEDITSFNRVFFINALIDLEDNIGVDIHSLRY